MLEFKRIGSELIMAREMAGFMTTTAAAEHMNMGRSKLSALENNTANLHVDDLMYIATRLDQPGLLRTQCKYNCRLGYYHHISPDPDFVKNTDKLINRLFDSIEDAYKLLPKIRKLSIASDFAKDPQLVEKTKLLFKIIEHDIAAFDLATHDIVSNKQIVKMYDKQQKVRV